MHAMNRAEAAAQGVHHPQDRALSPELWPQRSDRAAPVRVHRHDQQGHLSCATKPEAAASGRSGPARSTSTRSPRPRPALRRGRPPLPQRRATGGRTRISSASTSPRAGRALRGRRLGRKHRRISQDATKVTVGQVAREALHIETPRIGTAEQRRIAAAIEQLGWRRERSDGKTDWQGQRWWIPA